MMLLWNRKITSCAFDARQRQFLEKAYNGNVRIERPGVLDIT